MLFCCSWISVQSPQLATFWNWMFKSINNSAVAMMLFAFGHISPASESWCIFLKLLFIMKNSSHAFWWGEEWINSSLITLETQMLLWVGTEVRRHISVGMTSEWVCCSLNPVFFSLSVFSPRKQMEDCCDPAHLFAMTKMNSPMGTSMWYDGEFLYSFTIDNSTYSLFPQVSIEFIAFQYSLLHVLIL